MLAGCPVRGASIFGLIHDLVQDNVAGRPVIHEVNRISLTDRLALDRLVFPDRLIILKKFLQLAISQIEWFFFLFSC